MYRFLAVLLVIVAPTFALAQQAATLVADRVSVSPSGQLTASGNVEVFFDGTRMTASQVIYDQASDTLDITGPIVIQTAGGDVFLADQAQLDPKLEAGLLISARLVLNDQLQLAAAEIEHTAGTTTRMSQVGATSCTVCDGRPPLWEIRAQSVVHHQQAQQLYFDNAVLQIRGVPILWVPHLRMPDPTLTRATGLLRPTIRSNDQLGVGLKLPYFWRIGDNRDLTLTPYFSTQTRTVELRYRQAFRTGSISVNGAVSRDDILPDQTRGYLRVDGTFDIPRDFTLTFSGVVVTDQTYLLQYGYGDDENRLESNIRAERIDANLISWAEVAYFSNLSASDPAESLPPVIFDLGTERRVLFGSNGETGGLGHFGITSEGHFRYDDSTADSDRDVVRIGGHADASVFTIFDNGLLASADLDARLDYYSYGDDPSFNDGFRGYIGGAITLRYPLIASTDFATHLIEPTVMIGTSGGFGDPIANGDSTRTEFDESNIFTLNRFAGQDLRPEGTQTAAGVHWHRIGTTSQWSSRLFVGRVFQLGTPRVSDSSGLDGGASDWLIAGQLQLGSGLQIDGRTLLDDQFRAGKAEVSALWSLENLDLTANYVWLPADTDEDRSGAVSEWRVDADYDINDHWSIGVDGRFDVIAEQPARAGLRLSWQNECLRLALSASRRYVSSTTVEPSTDYDLSFDLLGFGTSATGAGARRVCTN